MGITQPRPLLQTHHVLLLWLAQGAHVVQSAEVGSTFLDVSLKCQGTSRVCTVGRRAPSRNISGGVEPAEAARPMSLSSKDASNRRTTLCIFVSLEHIYRSNKQVDIKLAV